MTNERRRLCPSSTRRRRRARRRRLAARAAPDGPRRQGGRAARQHQGAGATSSWRPSARPCASATASPSVIIRRKEYFSKPATRGADRRDGERGAGRRSPRSAGEGPARCAVCTTRWNSRNAAYRRRCSSRSVFRNAAMHPVPQQGHGRASLHRAAASGQQSHRRRDARRDAALRRPDGAATHCLMSAPRSCPSR